MKNEAVGAILTLAKAQFGFNLSGKGGSRGQA
jgi:hypothetical protein